MGYGWPYSDMDDQDAEARDDALEREEHEEAQRDRMDDHAPAAAPVLWQGSPEVVRLRAAVEELNASEGALVLEMPSAGPVRALKLAVRVGAARAEFGVAFEAVEARVGA